MICYYVFSRKPDEDLIVDVQDQFGRSVGDGGMAATPHPDGTGRWRLGPFYISDQPMSEFQAGVIQYSAGAEEHMT